VKALQTGRRAPGLPGWRVVFFWSFIRMIIQFIFGSLYGMILRGSEHVPARGPVIFVSNHQSHFDPPLVGVLVGDRPCAFLARASLFGNKVFGGLIRMLNAIPLDRDKPSSEALRAAMAELQAGRCVLLFPEGTRTRDGALGTFRPGFLLLVKRSKAPVVPVALEGLYDVWPVRSSRPSLRGRIALKAGEPIAAEDLLAGTADEAVDLVKRRIEQMRLDLRQQLRRASRNRHPAAGAGDVAYWRREEEVAAQG
jgi:1-acyl-sn-glycerol-3-phosphate acyltransferase